jgi:hypothetical protein
MDTTRRIRFEYCISFLFFTVRCRSQVITLEPGSSVFVASLPCVLITLFLGWWGVPWGLMVTPVILFRNLSGGIAEFTSPEEAACPAKPAASAESPSL